MYLLTCINLFVRPLIPPPWCREAEASRTASGSIFVEIPEKKIAQSISRNCQINYANISFENMRKGYFFLVNTRDWWNYFLFLCYKETVYEFIMVLRSNFCCILYIFWIIRKYYTLFPGQQYLADYFFFREKKKHWNE